MFASEELHFDNKNRFTTFRKFAHPPKVVPHHAPYCIMCDPVRFKSDPSRRHRAAHVESQIVPLFLARADQGSVKGIAYFYVGNGKGVAYFSKTHQANSNSL